MWWLLGFLWVIVGLIMMIPNPILGGIVLFGLCVWGLMAGPWWVIIICLLLMIGLAINIFGEA